MQDGVKESELAWYQVDRMGCERRGDFVCTENVSGKYAQSGVKETKFYARWSLGICYWGDRMG